LILNGRVVGNRQVFEFAKTEFDIARADPGGIVTCLIQHLMGHVDADDMAPVTDLPCREKTVKARPAAEIDDSLARLHGGNRLRVAATEPEISAVGNHRQLRLGIAHPARFIVRNGRALRAAA
jgi:hypothetical protein